MNEAGLPVPAPSPRAEKLVVALACVLFLALAGAEAWRNSYPYFDDVGYLEMGHQIRALGGPLGLLRELYAGHRYTESNRHPLFLALLSLVARPDLGYHRDAQLLTLALGVVALLSCWQVIRRHFGKGPALVAVLLLACGRTFVNVASREWCEPLLVALWAQAVGAVLDGLRRPGRPWPWLAGGVFSGLAFLTKGTAIFLPVCVALALLVEQRWRALVHRGAWLFGGAFLVTASPLLCRNVRLFHTPLYQFNSRLVWIDKLPDFAEVFAPHAYDKLPDGFLAWVAQVTPRALAWRVVGGVGEVSFNLLDAFALVAPTPGGPVHVALIVAALAALVISLRWLWRMPRGPARTFLLVHCAWSYAFFVAFSASGANSRYFLPLVATTLVPAFASRLWEALQAPAPRPLVRRTALCAAGAVAATALLHAPAMTPPPGMAAVEDWLVAHVRPGETYAVDARTHLQASWLLPGAEQLIVSASWDEKPVPAQELLDWLRDHRVRYVVLDGSALAHMGSPADPAARRYLFYDLLPLGPDGSLPLEGFPGDLALAYAAPDSPRQWLILETPWAEARVARR
ncbi:glycosyltransferase family 39 protein [Anaeromyxobacter paludicola]|uniref:Glycosyltransferase RgtA/B/C/D-like domain-containing protein n=1 Tax=Anaeromyxobacter paludicola TaxID=2918171 RepID=A0ABN6NEA5_9BACT|nr:glycosyltransferase family 39 protein [Anaeromyxobacter paludicola]BDG10372.1 hypothetical protein AMPC_34850 [Anaeromyxobacter paludicola]